MIKACIFDMDGTVSDTINSIAYFGNNALEKYGAYCIRVSRGNYRVLFLILVYQLHPHIAQWFFQVVAYDHVCIKRLPLERKFLLNNDFDLGAFSFLCSRRPRPQGRNKRQKEHKQQMQRRWQAVVKTMREHRQTQEASRTASYAW